jgi:hypothetical protein
MTMEFPMILIRCPECHKGFYVTASTRLMPRSVDSDKAVIKVSVNQIEHECEDA